MLRFQMTLGPPEVVHHTLQPLVEPPLDVGKRVASASPARRSRSANVARRSSLSRRSSAASWEIVSARSRASVRRISSV